MVGQAGGEHALIDQAQSGVVEGRQQLRLNLAVGRQHLQQRPL